MSCIKLILPLKHLLVFIEIKRLCFLLFDTRVLCHSSGFPFHSYKNQVTLWKSTASLWPFRVTSHAPSRTSPSDTLTSLLFCQHASTPGLSSPCSPLLQLFSLSYLSIWRILSLLFGLWLDSLYQNGSDYSV